MANYLIKKNKHHKKILIKSIDIESSYIINPKMKDNAKIKITEINIIDKGLIDEVITKKILGNYQKLFKMVYFYTNSDDATDEDARICLGEIDYLRSLIDTKYRTYLSIEKYKYLMNELYSLNAAVNKKIIINQMNRNIPYDMEYEEEKNRTL